MVFSSTIFIFIFLPVTLAGYYLLRGRNIRNIFLLIMSLIFYAWGEARVVFLLILSIIINYLMALMIDRSRIRKKDAKVFLIAATAFDLGMLFVFKYLGFFMTNLKALTGKDFAIPQIALPIGISFFTFQAISYVADIYMGRTDFQNNILKSALYIAFFPQLIAGPIVRYQSIEEQIDVRSESIELFASGIRRFTGGLAKKVLIANLVAVYVDGIFGTDCHERTVLLAWFGVLGYCLQIYFDFSGYSDMAIGLGRMFGFKIEENFNYPYISGSVSEFWRRWHMSLGQWFRDYVYIPLGGSRKGNIRHIINLFTVWILTGIWHGASWNFVLFGLYYFVFITAEHLLRNKFSEKFKKKPVFRIAAHLYTLAVIYFGWLIFRVTGIATLKDYLGDMFGITSHNFYDAYSLSLVVQYLPITLAGVFLSTPVFKRLYNKVDKVSHVAVNVVSIVLFITSLSFVVSSTYNPFIYFNF